MQHRYWIGKNYRNGAAGSGVLILGYSHYLGSGQHHEDMTVKTLGCVVGCKKDQDYGVDDKTPFFVKIAACFGQPTHLFWDRVIFMNLIPQAIGGVSEKYDWASHEQAVAGGKRLFNAVEANAVKKVFVFSSKAWTSLPNTIRNNDVALSATNPHGFNRFVEAPEMIAFHLRHPAFAAPQQLTELSEAVTLAMDTSRDFLCEIRKP